MSPTTFTGLAFLAVLAQAPQDPSLSLEAFDGAEKWPLLEPGDVEIGEDALTPHRTTFDFHLPDGRTTLMTVDLMPATLRGEPAYWIQHLSRGVRGDEEQSSVIDALLLDGETFRVAQRISGGPGPRSWTGPYVLTQYRPDEVIHVSVADGGDVEKEIYEDSTNTFDFATMGYLLPLVGLEDGKHFRLQNVGTMEDASPRDVFVRVAGRTGIAVPDGEPVPAWKVELLTHGKGMIVEFLVTEEAPYWYGWSFHHVQSGREILRWSYRDHVVLE